MTRTRVGGRRVAAYGACVLLFAFLSTARSQEISLQPQGIPYRRVFVPSSDLGSIGIEDFSRIEITRLEELLERYAKSAMTEFARENSSDDAGPVQLSSVYYVAKLDGADLLSERSRLTLKGTPVMGESLALRPWSLAIQSSSLFGAKTDLQGQNIWSFDAQGLPRIAMRSNEPDGNSIGLQKREFHFPFGWSAKADPASSANKLKFSFEIPRCANCCLVLALPPQAIVQDCSTAVRRVNEWQEVDVRLKDWIEFPKDNFRDPGTARSPESLWLIELGGSQLVSFAIDLGSSVGNFLQRDAGGLDSQKYGHLLRSQNIEHFVDDREIRTTCEAEIFASPKQPLFRMSLSPGARLRRLSVNQQEVEWEASDGWVQWSLPAMAPAVPSRNAMVYAEFISPLPTEMPGRLTTPHVEFGGGYVMAGTTVIHSDTAWKLTDVECGNGRITEPQIDSKDVGVNRIEYAWYSAPPSLAVALERNIPTPRCEILTRLSNDDKGMSAVIRAKFSFAEYDSNQVRILSPSDWSVVSVLSVDPNDPVSLQSSKQTSGPNQEHHLKWERLQKNRLAEIEIQMVRRLEDSTGQPRHLEGQPIVQIPNWKRSDTLVVENSDLFELKLQESLLDAMAQDDLIPDWQRSLFSKSGQSFVFRFDFPIHDANTVTFPALTWHKKRDRVQVRLSTEVDRVSGTALRARHQIHLAWSAQRKDPISISLPSKNVVWRLKEGSKWIPVEPTNTRSAEDSAASGVWLFDLAHLGSQCTLLAVVSSELKGEGEVHFYVPRILNSDVQNHEARSVSTDVVIGCEGAPSVWSIDEGGYKVLQFTPSETGAELVAGMSDKLSSKKWFAVESELHVAIDSLGSQKASLVYRSSSPPESAITIELDDGWSPITVRWKFPTTYQNVPFRVDGQRLVIHPEPLDIDAESELQVDLTGPRLAKKLGWSEVSQELPFRWPEFQSDAICPSNQSFLWLPLDLQIADSRILGQGNWPLWRGSRFVFESLFGISHEKIDWSEIERSRSFNRLVPTWSSSEWRVVRRRSNTTGEQLPTTSTIVDESIRINRVGSDRTYIALFFVIMAIATPRLILFRRFVATFVVAFLILVAHLAPPLPARFAFTGMIGMSAGFMLLVIHWLLSKPLNGDVSLSNRLSAKWSTWDRSVDSDYHHPQDRSGTNDGASIANLGSLLLSLAIGLGLAVQDAPIGSVARGQDDREILQAPIYQVVIPMDEAGNMAGSIAYVPGGMLDILNGKIDRTRVAERGTHPLSAKYKLKIGARGRFFPPSDQFIMVYEFWVGEDLEPVRFPINSSQFQFPRFSVDGIDLNLGNKLRSVGSEWIWTPDKPGKRTVQIVSLPGLKSNESDRNREFLTQVLDVAILPTANAQIEIETDPQNKIEIISQGRVTDPAPGQFLAMLGAVDRLQCSVIAPSSKAVGAFSIPPANTADIGDAPTMHTELLFHNDILQAKTIVDYPKGIVTNQEIEIEADLQWLPVGTLWGDAELIESRPGSTLARRRYLLNWQNGSSSSNLTSLSTRDRQISVVWVPQSTTQSLNVLFAECRDRRTRRGTLRYSGAPGANWSIEGINTWIPVIGSRDRLDWPELKTNPLATTLRIPANGGFGVVKPKAFSDRPQARVTTNWTLNHNRESLTTRIELPSGGASLDTFFVDLPNDFVVTDLSNRSGPVRYLQNKSEGKLRLQVLADRKSLEVSDLTIKARRQTQNGSLGNFDQPWLELPWISLPSTVHADQKLEIIASDLVALRMESEPGLIFGKGLGVPALNLAKSYTDIFSNTLAASRYQIIRRLEPIAGELRVGLNSNSTPNEIEVRGQFLHSAVSRPYFVLEVPSSLKDRWESESRLRSIPCPDPNKAWLQVNLPETSDIENASIVESTVKFVPRSDEAASDSELMGRIGALDSDRISTHIMDFSTDENSTAAKTDDLSVVPSIVKCILRIRGSHFSELPPSGFVLLESQYWVKPPVGTTSASTKLEWHLADNVEVKSIVVDGKPVDFDQDGQRVRIVLSQVGLCSDVIVFTKHRAEVNAAGKLTVQALESIGLSAIDMVVLLDENKFEVTYIGQSLVVTTQESCIGDLANDCLEMIEKPLDRLPNSIGINLDSDLAKWKRYWFQKAHGYLLIWSETADASQQVRFGAAVDRWHSLVPNSRLKFNVESTNDWVEPTSDSDLANKWYSLFGCFLIVLSLHLLTPQTRAFLFHRPWWCLLGLGIFAWLVFGTVLPTLVLGGIGLLVAADCYWLLTSRLRRNGTRGLRSL